MTSPGLDDAPIVLVRGTELTGLPVVSIVAGEAVADIKDVLYSPDDGRLTGFTLNKRGGLFAGPLKTGLSIGSVFAIGRDAVTIVSADALNDEQGPRDPGAQNVLGNTVLTDTGNRLGQVTDLVVEIGVLGGPTPSPTAGGVVGYQLSGDPSLQGREGHQLLIPLPFALAVSGTNLVVPATVLPFIRDDLSGFGGAVEQFRAQLGEPAQPGPGSAAPTPGPSSGALGFSPAPTEVDGQ